MNQRCKLWLGALAFGLVMCLAAIGQSLNSSQSAASSAHADDAEKLLFPELRLRLLQKFGNIFVCGPPVVRPDLPEGTFAKIRKDTEAFRMILKHLGLDPNTDLSQDQKQSVYREYQELSAIKLDPVKDTIKFSLGLREKSGDFRINGIVGLQGEITVLKKEQTVFVCPICLAAGTLIDTPEGPVAVNQLKPGALVWTLDANHHRIAVPAVRVAKVPILTRHWMVHLVLQDGRELWASPGHPTVDGRSIADLKSKSVYDGASIRSSEIVPYQGDATYDLLPAGDTGVYWANGILLASTIR